MPDARPTMKVVARAANVSQSAVSLALRGKPGISASTRERIRQTAKRLGYRPDPALNSLIEYRWNRQSRGSLPHTGREIAVLVPPGRDFPRLLPAIQERAAEHGFGVDRINIGSTRDYEQVLQARGERGVLLINLPSARDELQVWQPQSLAVVEFGISRGKTSAHAVLPDLVFAAEDLAGRLQSTGHQRIAFGTFQSRNTGIDTLRKAAIGLLREELGARCLAIPAFHVHDPDQRDLLEWVDKHQPDLLVGVNDYFALKLSQHSAPVGSNRKSAHISLSNSPDHAWISGYVVAAEEIGRRAVDCLVRSLARLEFGPPKTRETTLLTSTWNQGATFLGSNRLPGDHFQRPA